MSDHPENQSKMHEPLEAYARKRRADAGAPKPMPPATRQLLQKAVQEQFSKTSAGAVPSSSLSLLSRLLPYLPRLAFAFGLLAVLALGARFLVGTDHQKATQLARQNAPVTPAPSSELQPPELVAAPATDSALSPRRAEPSSPSPEARNRRSPSTLNGQLDSAGSSLREESQLPAPARMANAPTPNAPAPSEPAPVLTFNLTAQTSPAVLPPATPLPTPSSDLLAKDLESPARSRAVAQRRQSAASTPLLAESAVAQNKLLSVLQTPPVLANFELEQVGERLRLIDAADGSIYEGRLFVGPASGADRREDTARLTVDKDKAAKLDSKTSAFNVAPETSKAEALRTTSTPSREPARATSAPAVAAWSFRVNGTNRTLQEPVQLDGLLMASPDSSAVRPVQAVRTKSSGARFYRATPSALTWAATNYSTGALADVAAIRRIQGTLRVGATNRTQLDAYRVAP